MTTQTLFRLTRWTLATSVILTIAAMVVYPGGTLLDPRVPHYSFFQNFLSDLGMARTRGALSNRLGAALFVASFGLLAVACVACALGFVRFHACSSRARPFAYAGGGASFSWVLALLAPRSVR
jgi:hypothetical membrane protein